MAAGAVEVDITSANAEKGAIFDGTNDEVMIPSGLISNDANYTLIAVAMPVDVVGTQILLNPATSTSAVNRIYIGLSGAQARFEDRGSTTQGKAFGTVVAGQWTHIAASRDSTTASLYQEGLPVTTQTVTVNEVYAMDRTGIGLLARSAKADFFAGTISQARVYNRALSAAEILADKNGDISRVGLIGEWTFDDGTYDDTTGNNNGAESGTRIAIVDSDIAAVIKADRTTINDIYLIAETANNQAISVVIEEAP